MNRARLETYLITANDVAMVLRDIPPENRAAQSKLLRAMMVLLDEARQLAGADYAEVSQI